MQQRTCLHHGSKMASPGMHKARNNWTHEQALFLLSVVTCKSIYGIPRYIVLFLTQHAAKTCAPAT